jgi:hypothetical protein
VVSGRGGDDVDVFEVERRGEEVNVVQGVSPDGEASEGRGLKGDGADDAGRKGGLSSPPDVSKGGKRS